MFYKIEKNGGETLKVTGRLANDNNVVNAPSITGYSTNYQKVSDSVRNNFIDFGVVILSNVNDKNALPSGMWVNLPFMVTINDKNYFVTLPDGKNLTEGNISHLEKYILELDKEREHESLVRDVESFAFDNISIELKEVK